MKKIAEKVVQDYQTFAKANDINYFFRYVEPQEYKKASHSRSGQYFTNFESAKKGLVILQQLLGGNLIERNTVLDLPWVMFIIDGMQDFYNIEIITKDGYNENYRKSIYSDYQKKKKSKTK